MVNNRILVCLCLILIALTSFVSAEQIEEITLEGNVDDILEGSFLIENEMEGSILVNSFTTNEAMFNYNYEIEFSEEDEFTLDFEESKIIYFKIIPRETMIRRIEIIGEISHIGSGGGWWGRPTYVIVNLIVEENGELTEKIEEQVEKELIEEIGQEKQEAIQLISQSFQDENVGFFRRIFNWFLSLF